MRGALRYSLIACVLLGSVTAAAAEPAVPVDAADGHELNIDGRRIVYTIEHPAADDPSGALAAARKIHEHLARGDIEEAALLSNTPKRRYEIYREYLQAVGEEEFRKVFSQYLAPASRVLAEIGIGSQRLLVWQLDGLAAPAGEFFVEIDGRFLMDDVPGETRQQLRRILELYRSTPPVQR